MRLSQLEPRFLRVVDESTFRHVDTLAEAHGIRFLCPKCFAANGGAAGTHGVICWSRSRGAPDHIRPLPGRWAMTGTDFDNLSLIGDSGASDSVFLAGGCGWHGFVTNGEVSIL